MNIPETCLEEDDVDNSFSSKMKKYKDFCGEEEHEGHIDFGDCAMIYDRVDKDELMECNFDPQLGTAIIQVRGGVVGLQ